MSTCDMGFEHPGPEPVVIEEALDTEPIAEAEVRVAEIQANRDVAIAKIANRGYDEETVAEMAALRAENETLRAQLAPPAEEQEQAVVVVAEPEPEPAEAEPPVIEAPAENTPKKASNPFWR